MARRIEDTAIKYSTREEGTTIRFALDDVATLMSEKGGEARELFAALLRRCEAALVALNGLPRGHHSLQLSKNLFVELVTKFTGLVHSYCRDSLAGRVVQHKKLVKTLEVLHGKGVYGLDQVHRLIHGPMNVDLSWRDAFVDQVKTYNETLKTRVDGEVTREELRAHPEVVEEFKTLLLSAKESRDNALWNELTKELSAKLALCEALEDSSTEETETESAALLEWFLATSSVSYSTHAFGPGSFGAVHYGTRGGTDVVVKILLPTQYSSDSRWSPQDQSVFATEANLWHEMSHPNVLRLYGACDTTLPPFVVGEEAAEGELSEMLATNKSKIWRLLHEAALGIEYLPSNRVVHGDLKLDNILVGAEGYARIADFGLSCPRNSPRNDSTRVQTPRGQSVGALRWRASECFDRHKSQPASDVYSFAMSIIEACAGTFPYAGLRDDVVRRKIKMRLLPARPAGASDGTRQPVESRCPRCQHRVDSNNVCSRCNMSVTPTRMLITPESLVIKSKEDLPRVIELLTLGTDEHKKFASSALREYLFGKPEHQIEVYDAGAVPILTKLLKDTPLAQGTDANIAIDALLTRGCTAVGNKKNQSRVVLESAIPLAMTATAHGSLKIGTKSMLNGDREIRRRLITNEESHYISEAIRKRKTWDVQAEPAGRLHCLGAALDTCRWRRSVRTRVSV